MIPIFLASAAEQIPSDRDPTRVLVPLLVLAGLVLLAWLAIVSIRRRLHGTDAPPAVAFTLEDLRRLHAAGDLTDEEFGRAQERIIGDADRESGDDPR